MWVWGGGKETVSVCPPVGAGVQPMAGPPQHTAKVCFHLRQIRTSPVGNAVLGVPRSSTEPKQAVRRIRIHLVGRADPGAPRSSTRFPTNPRVNPQPPFLPPAGEGGIRRSPARRMTEEGEPDRQRAVKSFAYSPRLRSFPRRGPATFSLSCRPCGRHPPPLGEGMGESAVDDINGPARPQRSLVGGGVPDAPAVTPRFRQTMGEFAERF